MLDVVITKSNHPEAVNVEPPTLSDHSFITASIDLKFNHGQPITAIRRRQWRRFNVDNFCDDLRSSTLLTDPPSDAIGLFACDDATLMTLVDKQAPFADVKILAHHAQRAMVRRGLPNTEGLDASPGACLP